MKFYKGKVPQFPGSYNEHGWMLVFLTRKDRDEAARVLKAAFKYLDALKKGEHPGEFTGE